MSEEFERPLGGFKGGSVRTYSKVINLMAEVWERCMGAPLENLQGPPSQRFASALKQFEAGLQSEAGKRLRAEAELASAGDPVLKSFLSEDVGTEPNGRLEVDHVPPTTFKRSIYEEARSMVEGPSIVEVPLDNFLRGVVGRIAKELAWPHRINVGENRHFPRMFQWLLECEDETRQEEGRGIWVLNEGGRGPIPADPIGPYGLKVRLNPDFL